MREFENKGRKRDHPMTICYIALGSNLKTPERQLHLALARLRRLPRIQLLAVAPFYRNSAVGRKAQPDFCNTVAKISTTLSPKELLLAFQKIETQQGRIRRKKWDARTLDLDILFYGTRHIKTPTLIIPHPRLAERDFVTIPFRQIQHL